MAAFAGKKYDDAAAKALGFIKSQMDVSAWAYGLQFAEVYDETYAHQLMWGTVTGLSPDDDKIFPRHINVNEYYAPDYTGSVAGTWFGLSDVKFEYVGVGDGQTVGCATNQNHHFKWWSAKSPKRADYMHA